MRLYYPSTFDHVHPNLPPFDNVLHGTNEDNYNFFHSSSRICVECTFGEIDLRWGILWRASSVQLGEGVFREKMCANLKICTYSTYSTYSTYRTYSTYSTYRRALDLRIVGILDIFAITTDNFVPGTSVVPETSIAQRTSRLCSSFNKLQNDDIQ